MPTSANSSSESCECVVNDEGQTVFVRNGCERINIRNVGIGIAQRFDIDCLGVRLNGAFHFGRIVRIHKRGCDAVKRQRVSQQIGGAAIVGWEAPCIQQVRKALDNSAAVFTAYDGEQVVGMVRLIGDGGMSFYVRDFAVIPACQAKGVGSLLLEHLEAYIMSTLPEGWAVSLELISSKEAVPFYEKRGFEKRPCAWDGPGMMKMLRR